MAGRIQGITVEIGGDTTKLQTPHTIGRRFPGWHSVIVQYSMDAMKVIGLPSRPETYSIRSFCLIRYTKDVH